MSSVTLTESPRVVLPTVETRSEARSAEAQGAESRNAEASVVETPSVETPAIATPRVSIYDHVYHKLENFFDVPDAINPLLDLSEFHDKYFNEAFVRGGYSDNHCTNGLVVLKKAGTVIGDGLYTSVKVITRTALAAILTLAKMIAAAAALAVAFPTFLLWAPCVYHNHVNIQAENLAIRQQEMQRQIASLQAATERAANATVASS